MQRQDAERVDCSTNVRLTNIWQKRAEAGAGTRGTPPPRCRDAPRVWPEICRCKVPSIDPPRKSGVPSSAHERRPRESRRISSRGTRTERQLIDVAPCPPGPPVRGGPGILPEGRLMNRRLLAAIAAAALLVSAMLPATVGAASPGATREFTRLDVSKIDPKLGPAVLANKPATVIGPLKGPPAAARKLSKAHQ